MANILNIITLALLVLTLLIELVSLAVSVARRKKALAVALKARNEMKIGYITDFGECFADLFRINTATEKEFTMFIHGEEPKPLKEGDVFLRCVDGCDKRDTCPVLKRLKDPVVAHNVGAADGLRIIKSSTFDNDGTMYSRVYKPGDDEKITVNGIMLTSAYDPGKVCYVRTDLPCQKSPENA